MVLQDGDQAINIQQDEDNISSLLTKKSALMGKKRQSVPRQYLVVYEHENTKLTVAAARNRTDAIMAEYQIQPTAIKYQYEHSVKGFAAELSKKQLAQLKNDPRVKYVEQDRTIMLSPPGKRR